MKPFAVLIPERIDIEEIVNINPSLFEEDYLKYLMNTIVIKQGQLIENKERNNFFNESDIKISDSTKEYIKIEALYKGEKYNKHKLLCEYICQNNIELERSMNTTKKVSLFERKQYKNRKNSYEYRLGWYFRKQLLKVEYITDGKLIHAIKRNQSRCDSELKRDKYKFLNKFFNYEDLKIDFQKAIKLCEDRYNNHRDYNKYSKELTQIVNIHNGVYRLIYKKNSIGRVYTNITQLNKEYRKFITYRGKSLSEVDLSNSVLFFLALILNKSNINKTINLLSNSNYKSINNILEGNNLQLLLMFSEFAKNPSHKEIELVQKLSFNGEFYNFFVSDFENNYSFEEMKYHYSIDNEDEYIGTEKQNRKICKKQLLAMLFAQPTQYLKVQELFKKSFPDLLEMINLFKAKVGYKKFAYLLFQIEAFFVINVVARNFNKLHWRKAPVFTLHDALITTSEYVNELQHCLDKNLVEILGCAPNTEIKNW